MLRLLLPTHLSLACVLGTRRLSYDFDYDESWHDVLGSENILVKFVAEDKISLTYLIHRCYLQKQSACYLGSMMAY